ncbi:hypothetical protein Tco_0378798 [Tanacetum coccineum]
MNTRARKGEKALCSKDSEVEDGVHPRTPIAVRKAQGIRKITLRAKIVKNTMIKKEKQECDGVTETDPFTSRIRHFDFPKTRMPSHVKTYNGSKDPEDHLKIFQAAAKMERKSASKTPIVLHNIKQRDGESTEDFKQRYKSESGNVKGAPECMRISGFVHGIKNPELIKRFHEKILKIVDEMMQVATSFLQGQEAASNQERKKVPQAWRHQEGGHRQNFKKGGGFRSQHKTEKRPFTLLTKTPKEIMALWKKENSKPHSNDNPG